MRMPRWLCGFLGHRWHQHEWTDLWWDSRTLQTEEVTMRVMLCDRCGLWWEDQ